MIQKSFIKSKGRSVARVTFILPNCTWANAIYLVGDFNDWNRTSDPLQRDREGDWRLTLDLDLGRAYQFRYLRDGEEWMNDNQADAQVTNPYGSANSVVITDTEFIPYYDGKE
jgi:1,4-alpha-glucan branching enzyme